MIWFINLTQGSHTLKSLNERWLCSIKSILLLKNVMINYGGKRMTKASEGTEEAIDSEHNQAGETRGYRHSHHQLPHAFSGIFACGFWGSPGYGGLPLINLILFYNKIWFDYC